MEHNGALQLPFEDCIGKSCKSYYWLCWPHGCSVPANLKHTNNKKVRLKICMGGRAVERNLAELQPEELVCFTCEVSGRAVPWVQNAKCLSCHCCLTACSSSAMARGAAMHEHACDQPSQGSQCRHNLMKYCYTAGRTVPCSHICSSCILDSAE